MNRATRVATLIALAIAFCILPVYADDVSGTIFYTTFTGGVNVHKVNFDFNGLTLSYTGNTGIAATSGADGILFAPDGNLYVCDLNGGGVLRYSATDGSFIGFFVDPGRRLNATYLTFTKTDPTTLNYNPYRRF